MTDYLSYLDFVIDMVCFMPPLNEVDIVWLGREQSMLIAFGAMGLLMVAVTAKALGEIFPNTTIACVVMAVCVAALSIAGLKQGMIQSVFTTAYPPLVITLRFAEGALVGGRTPLKLRWWYGFLCIAFLVGLYVLSRFLPKDMLVVVKTGWAILGIITASVLWSRLLADTPPFQNPLVLVGVFAVFASTLAYISTSSFEQNIYKWVLPLGLFVGMFARRKLRPLE